MTVDPTALQHADDVLLSDLRRIAATVDPPPPVIARPSRLPRSRSMNDLATRLSEALDRAEQAAGACITPDYDTWYVEHHECAGWCRKPCKEADTCASRKCGCCSINGATRIYDEGGHDSNDAEHIVAWQPKRVLALVARDRLILGAHARVEDDDLSRMLDRLRGGWCAHCIPDDEPGETLLMPWPCETVQIVAAFWLPEEDVDV